MIRRLLRILVAAFCLLSLLVALGVSWLWWECRHGRGYVADATAFGRYFMAESRPGGRKGVILIRDWPGRPTLRVWTQHGYYEEHGIYWSSISTRQKWQMLGVVAAEEGQLVVHVRQDTDEAVRWYPGNMPTSSIVRPSPPMPLWSVGDVNAPSARSTYSTASRICRTLLNAVRPLL